MPRIRMIDEVAAGMPWMASMSPCLHIPIAARDRAAIECYVGEIVTTTPENDKGLTFLIAAHEPPPLGPRLPVWELAEAAQLHAREQVWVHIESRSYRRAFQELSPQSDLKGRDVDHVMNREIARLKGFPYVRVIPIIAAANRSSGALSEKWGIEYHRTPRMREVNRKSRAQVQYADIADLVKMLSINTGGGVMDAVNQAQGLFEVPGDS